jgi:hypothetical protein
VRIEARFGSQFQRSVAIRNLNKLLATWKALVEEQHKKPQGSPKTGQSGSPENRPVVDHHPGH